jgi:hypothetical protein
MDGGAWEGVSMEKVYRLLEWLDTKQAIDWLQLLTGAPITIKELMRLCEAEHCDPYVDATGVRGCFIDHDGHEVTAVGRGMQKVLNREVTFLDGKPIKQHLSLEGARRVPDPSDDEQTLYAGYDYWEITAETGSFSIFFKPADIQTLADKINGVAEQPNAGLTELEDLRQQLEQERAKREAAEAELLKRRGEDGTRALNDMRSMLGVHDHKEFSAMQKRAVYAENMVAALDLQLTEQSERRRRSEEMTAELAKRLSTNNQGPQASCQSESPTTGLAFPYSTKELEAMKAAALKYWANYTPDKRQPTQKEVGYELCELLSLPRQANNEPARKAVVLATAIRPDTLPET